METYEDCKKEVAQKHKLGKTLVTGHRATYFEEAAELYADIMVKKMLPDEKKVCLYQGTFCSFRITKVTCKQRNPEFKCNYSL